MLRTCYVQDGIVHKDKVDAPVLISLYGGIGISLGLIMFGKRVIRTMGTEISRMTPSRYRKGQNDSIVENENVRMTPSRYK